MLQLTCCLFLLATNIFRNKYQEDLSEKQLKHGIFNQVHKNAAIIPLHCNILQVKATILVGEGLRFFHL